tara:strand:- start:1090 stop:1854 length:765 start_codon:yes stop_codon:yes gene_type:complete
MGEVKEEWKDVDTNPSLKDTIRIYSHSGLCNRLRLIADYRHLSLVKKRGMQVFWPKSKQCNTSFSDLFKPISNTTFQYLESPRRPKNTASRRFLFPHKLEIYQQNHLIFEPIDPIQQKIDEIKDRIGEGYISCHVRRSDIETIQRKYKKEAPSNEFFFNFIDRYPNKNVFLATDSKKTQERFAEMFGERLFFACTPSGEGSKRWPKRTTSIVEAVVDLFLCIGSYDFIGTTCSSYTDFIKNYRSGKTHRKLKED